ncbi:SHOCT domain-containing protein [Treponema zuelzerae]|uniref:SHOCT domain-containing protein n=1 Tax=Teretinema zuelzerae TaxID=156 RepID=A0AAE3JKE9_9SPIR|nr:SHOCT domain-containing protein [Teretinema zuelzerae]MCD1655195.1 SHOCT domain-containing protein [Teretinema zuelzerae]
MFGNICSGFMGLHGIGGFIVMAIFIAIVVIALVVLFKGRGSDKMTNDSAMTELRLRFAKGEITQEEYERTRTSL